MATTARTIGKSPYLHGLARFGYGAKGIVYLIIGAVAAQAAVMGRGRATDETGALARILSQPFGRIILVIVAAGLFSYALWRFVEMAIDPEAGPKDKSRALQRFQYAVSGAVYTALGIEALRMIAGMRSGGGGEAEADEQARFLLSVPFGHWLLIVVAVAAIGFGLEELYRALSRKFEDRQKLVGMSVAAKPWLLRTGRLGIFARGLVGTVVGTYFLLAGLHRSPSEARGPRGAIESLGQQPFGRWILILIAVGLFAYGVYMLVDARYRKLAH